MHLGLILAALAFPLLELALLIKLGQSIGFWSTVLLLAATAVGGGLLVNAQGAGAMQRAMEALNQGRAPLEPVTDSFLIIFAGMLLMIPGLITDAMGLLLLVPPVRRRLARWALGGMTARGGARGAAQWRSPGRAAGTPVDEQDAPAPRRNQSPVVIDGEWERIDGPGDTARKPPNSNSRDDKPS